MLRSETEAHSVQQLKNIFSNTNYDDTRLLRFLRARDGDVKKAQEMIEKSLAWRDENKINSLVEWCPPQELVAGFDVYQCGCDVEGRPVFYAPLGIWASARDLYNKGMEEECLRFAAKLMDLVHTNLLKTRNQNFICIVDVAGATYSRALYELRNLKGIQDAIMLFHEYEQNFPETLNRAFVINTPSVFYWGFNIVKPLMSKSTLSKIRIFDMHDESWVECIREVMPEEAIPEKLGGKGVLVPLLE